MKLNANPNDASLRQDTLQRQNARTRSNPSGEAPASAANVSAQQQNAAPLNTGGIGATRTMGGDARVSGRTTQLMAAANDPRNDVDMERVESIKAALANGTYQIDSSRIADGMLRGSRELMSPSGAI
ncbi:flagellar biosynthesis anti-sigma factor FlgM [Robbsia andropogonis]|uniref:flagellar biosynthesis anti-sigma factor FlgM n=1 Tax=Robbsia andropogonis TaxID=28092 RepID=UPI00209EAA2C|nr:flagellar biosynthesis anti-sigma factor FlgM [Robbsia andropogonis]MCP1118748.1 flagellar biosynthesis anti-sigma factor FlgM [Robbsia andropogonis]MCP1128215.1 flagellar biosynthesis anti-sigma factor FlgM [Robbsia andropogonis]